MIKHLFKLSWNKKRKYVILLIELFFAYLVTAFLILFLFEVGLYRLDTANFSIENLIEIGAGSKPDELKQRIQAMDEVQNVSLTDLTPYSNIVTNDTLHYGNQTLRVYKWKSDENLFSTIGLSLESGRWFTRNDRGSMKSPVILTSTLSEQLLPGVKAEGKIIKIGSKEYTVAGIVKDLNDPTGRYKNRPHLFVLDTGRILLVKLKKPMTTLSYNKLKMSIPGSSYEFRDMVVPVSKHKEEFLSQNRGAIFVVGFISAFLLINVILGLFSILHQNINKRRPEIGLRRASGATAGDIYLQIVLEVILLTTIAIMPAIIVAYQFVLFNVFGDTAKYYPSMIIAAGVIYSLVIICSLYPASIAARVTPSEALHEE